MLCFATLDTSTPMYCRLPIQSRPSPSYFPLVLTSNVTSEKKHLVFRQFMVNILSSTHFFDCLFLRIIFTMLASINRYVFHLISRKMHINHGRKFDTYRLKINVRTKNNSYGKILSLKLPSHLPIFLTMCKSIVNVMFVINRNESHRLKALITCFW